MTTLDLSAITEAAAEAFYEATRSKMAAPWVDAPDFFRSEFREGALAAVLATLRALEPLADRYGSLKRLNADIAAARNEEAERAETKGDHFRTRNLYARSREAAAVAKVYRHIETDLRALLPAATNTSTEVS